MKSKIQGLDETQVAYLLNILLIRAKELALWYYQYNEQEHAEEVELVDNLLILFGGPSIDSFAAKDCESKKKTRGVQYLDAKKQEWNHDLLSDMSSFGYTDAGWYFWDHRINKFNGPYDLRSMAQLYYN